MADHQGPPYIYLIRQKIMKQSIAIKCLVQDIHKCLSLEELNDKNGIIRDEMMCWRKEIEKLEKLAFEQDRELDKENLQQEVNDYKKAIEEQKGHLRKANVATQLVIEQRNTTELMASNTAPMTRKRKNKEQLAEAASQVSDNLLSISRAMSEQVERSRDTLDVLQNSSTKITETKGEFKSMGGAIGESRKLLNKYGRRENTDAILIVLALTFFFGCVLYILKKRIL